MEQLDELSGGMLMSSIASGASSARGSSSRPSFDDLFAEGKPRGRPEQRTPDCTHRTIAFRANKKSDVQPPDTHAMCSSLAAQN